MGLQDFFTIKTPRQREAEQKQYNAWAFPYGQRQQQIVAALIAELLPEEKKTGMAIYLIGRQAYRGYIDEDYSDYTQQGRVANACRTLRSQLPGRHKHKLWRYLALILADAEVGEDLAYPDAEALRKSAQALQEQLG